MDILKDGHRSGLSVHHIGFACTTIENGLQFVKQIFDVRSISDAIFDPCQKATVCMIETGNGISIELVSGPVVTQLLGRGVSLYHLAYAVKDIEESIRIFAKAGARKIGEVVPAKLFNGSRVCFLQTQLGMVELVETSYVKGPENGPNTAQARSNPIASAERHENLKC